MTVNNITNIYNNMSVPYVGADRDIDLNGVNLLNSNSIQGNSGNFSVLNVTTLNIGDKVLVGSDGSASLIINSSLTGGTNTYAMILNALHRGAGLVGTMLFNLNFDNDSPNGASAVILDGNFNFKNSTNSYTGYGLRLKTNNAGVPQTAGTRTSNLADLSPVIPQQGTGGTSNLNILNVNIPSIFKLSGNQNLNIKGITISRSTFFDFGTGTDDIVGLKLTGFGSGIGLENEKALYVDGGKSVFNGNLNVTSGGTQSNDYYSGDGSQGLTVQLNMTGCNITVKDGLIVNYVGCS